MRSVLKNGTLGRRALHVALAVTLYLGVGYLCQAASADGAQDLFGIGAYALLLGWPALNAVPVIKFTAVAGLAVAVLVAALTAFDEWRDDRAVARLAVRP